MTKEAAAALESLAAFVGSKPSKRERAVFLLAFAKGYTFGASTKAMAHT